jgi:DNA-directed RNA polymerase specialized sigma24 family protein
MTTQEYFKNIDRLDSQIERMLSDRERIATMGARVSPNLSGEPRGGTSDKVCDCATRLADMDAEINRLIDKYADARKEATKLINRLPYDEGKVIHLRYIEHLPFERIAKETNYSESMVYCQHKSAVLLFNEILKMEEIYE